MEPITITLSWWMLFAPYLLSKIAYAVFIQLRYRPQWTGEGKDLWLHSEKRLWSGFATSLLMGLETAILKTLVYPIYWVVVGRLTLKQWILPTKEEN